MRISLIALITAILCACSSSQSDTTETFHESHEEAFSLYFYRNTLRMLNMLEDPKIDELIRGVDHMKFLRISKSESAFSKEEYSRIVDQYHAEAFEDLMSMRSEGMNFTVLIKEKNNVTEGIIVLLDGDDDFAIVDIDGTVPLDKVPELVKYVQSLENTDLNWD